MLLYFTIILYLQLGSGYILGHKLLNILNTKEIKYFGFEFDKNNKIDYSDIYRSNDHIRYLSLLTDALQTSKLGCKTINTSTCITNKIVVSNKKYHKKYRHSDIGSFVQNNSSDLVVPIGVRLIELCTNLMANEHACHHRLTLLLLSFLYIQYYDYNYYQHFIIRTILLLL